MTTATPSRPLKTAPLSPPPPARPPKPATSAPISDWSDFGFYCGQAAAAVDNLPSQTFKIKYSVGFLAEAARAAMRQNGIQKNKGDRSKAFIHAFREGFIRGIVSRTGISGFCLVVEAGAFGTKNVKLTPDAGGPFWTLQYLDGGLDVAKIRGVKDPFAEVEALKAREWPSQT